MDRKEKDLVHVINTKTGQKQTIQISQCNSCNKSDFCEFKIDYEWYYQNGYMNIEDAIKEIERSDK